MSIFSRLCVFFFATAAACAAAQGVMLPSVYAGQNVNGWLASEKLDGVRGIWDGKTLLSRQGKPFKNSKELTQGFPPFALDGELFVRRNYFSATAAQIRRGDWSGIRLHVFDVPDAQGGLEQRLDKLKHWLATHPHRRIAIIPQTRIDNIQAARKMLADIEKQGGEGLVLREPNAPYPIGRTDKALKLKSFQDAECTVTEHIAGKGKNSERTGALGCRLDDGRIIRIGSGLSDALRNHPPAIGTRITFRYRGLTSSGKPRFATYWRERKDGS